MALVSSIGTMMITNHLILKKVKFLFEIKSLKVLGFICYLSHYRLHLPWGFNEKVYDLVMLFLHIFYIDSLSDSLAG